MDDVNRTARLLISIHGVEAVGMAERAVRGLRYVGRAERAAHWDQVVEAIKAIQATE